MLRWLLSTIGGLMTLPAIALLAWPEYFPAAPAQNRAVGVAYVLAAGLAVWGATRLRPAPTWWAAFGGFAVGFVLFFFVFGIVL